MAATFDHRTEGEDMEYVIFVGIIQALVAAGLLWRSKLRNTADGLLIALAICVASHLTIKFLIFSFVADKEVRLSMNTFINYCYGPLIYLYALKLCVPGFSLIKRWFIFLPAAIAMIAYFSIASILLVAPAKGYGILNLYNTLTIFTILPSEVAFSCTAIFLVKKYLPVGHKERRLVLQVAACFVTVSSLAFLFLFIPLDRELNSVVFRFIGYGMLTFICIRIVRYRYVAYRDAVVPAVEEAANEEPGSEKGETPVLEEHALAAIVAEPEVVPRVLPQPAVQRSAQEIEDMALVLEKLDKGMREQCLYVDSGLSLDRLAAATGLNKYHISETLNHYAKKSFYQYVNEYRVRDVMEKMQQFSRAGLPVNMLTVAYDAGFNSKSSFNRHFKELKGLTPTEFFRTLEQEFKTDREENSNFRFPIAKA